MFRNNKNKRESQSALKKRKKTKIFLAPTQLLIQGQWWS